ncbi:sodium- and chloride-dependent glycine transporter 1-like [Ruditapes philippinarum]|uniref:sodium- and chloride-dependent glycine transporter 1-like n=1 Tax=Ruditapes philippinarum TaxID=129788 RepID=UPI00295BCF09|nr:sodium- and chloride-dependent glycine transporter 1-like [Ruditapes philippinarum]
MHFHEKYLIEIFAANMDRHEETPLQSSVEAQNSEKSGHSEESEVSMVKKKAQFSGSCSFLVSLLGYSMGTSDFWRFPYLVFRNGGGAFLFPFAIFMMLVGMPLLFFEVSVSQFSARGPLSMWNLAPFFKGIGDTLFAINLLNNVYYNILRAWILEYFVDTFQAELPWASCNHEWNRPGCIAIETERTVSDFAKPSNATMPAAIELHLPSNITSNVTQMTSAEQYWQYKVLQLSSGLGDFDGIIWDFILYIFIWRLLVTLCMVKSIKSIEKVMFVTVFVPILLMLVIWVRSLMLNGAVTGMLYYLTPTFDRITDPRVWLEAALMACYTLGPGWGTIPLIGSHNKFHGNTIKYSVISTVGDFLSAVLNGLICFSVLGVMAHDSGLDLEKTVTSGLSLGFTVYPTAFTYFPLPQFWSAVFFVNLMLVGLDSQVLSTETVMNCLQDMFPKWFKGRRRSFVIVFLNIGFFLLTIPFCTRGGMYIFQLLDWYAAAWTLLFVCFIECLVFTWVYGTERLSKDVEIMVGRPLPAFIRISGAFFSPCIFLAVTILSFAEYRPPSYGSYRYPAFAEAVGWCLAFLIISPIIIVFVFNIIKTWRTDKKISEEIKRPCDTWGPHDYIARADYNKEDRNINRGYIGTLMYNITGRTRATKSVTCNSSGLNSEKDIKLTDV